jgi:hypothetical protein
MMDTITVGQAKTIEELEQILVLQAMNHPHTLTAEQRAKEGFVTVKHNLEVLQKMNNAVGQIIAKDGDTVVGYALVMPEEFKNDDSGINAYVRDVHNVVIPRKTIDSLPLLRYGADLHCRALSRHRNL